MSIAAFCKIPDIDIINCRQIFCDEGYKPEPRENLMLYHGTTIGE